MKVLLIYTPVVAAAGCATAAASVVVKGPDPALVSGVSNFIVLGGMGLFSGAAVFSGTLLLRSPRWPPRLLGVLSFLSMLVLGLWFQRHTDLGIFLLGGDSVWVRYAAGETTPEARGVALATALQGTQYAFNTVETIILEDYADDPELQSYLFLLLSEVTSNARWSQRYEERSRRAFSASRVDGR